MSTGHSGACFQAQGGESAGNGLQALTHQPQACHSSPHQLPHHASPQPGFAGSGGGWGGVNHDPEAGSAEPRIISGGHKKKRHEKKEKLGFHFLKLPPFKLLRTLNHSPLTGCEKQKESSPSFTL